MGGGSRRGLGGGSGRVSWGGSRWGELGCWGGGGARAPLTSTCPPSNHIKAEYWDRAGGEGNISYDW